MTIRPCSVLAIFCLVSVASAPALAQNAVEVDPKHYTVEYENAEVRVLRIRYGAHERSVMHQHPDAVAVFLSDQKTRFTLASGEAVERANKAGEVLWLPAEKHLPENLSDQPFELILIELKHGAPKTAE